MTTRNRSYLIAIIVIALNTLLANFAEGQHPSNTVTTNSLPVSLNMMGGGHDQFLEWILTNRTVSLGYSASWTNSLGHYITVAPVMDHSNLTSYAQFENWTVEKGLTLLTNDLEKSDVASTVRFISTIGYWYGDVGVGQTAIITANDNIGYVTNITPSSFMNMPITWVAAPIEVPGLQSFTVRVETDVHDFTNQSTANSFYCYSWTNAGSPKISAKAAFFPPEEYTTDRFVYFNEWYSTNGYPARFTISANGQSRTYTQYGDELQCSLAMCPEGLTVSMARGAFVEVQGSADLTNWSHVTWIDGSSGISKISVAFGATEPRQFFRAIVW